MRKESPSEGVRGKGRKGKRPYRQRPAFRFIIFVILIVYLQLAGEWVVMVYKMGAFVQGAQAGTLEVTDRPQTYQAAGSSSLGAPGDILLTFKAVNKAVSLWVGGHAGVVVDQERTIESSGLEPWAYNTTKYWRNNWLDRYDTVLVLRPKGSTVEEAEEAVRRSKALLGTQYDIFFLPGEKWIYCSELPQVAYQEAGYNFNYDGLYITPHDLLLSPDMEIVYLSYRDGSGQSRHYRAAPRKAAPKKGRQ